MNFALAADRTKDSNSIFTNNWEVLVMRKIPSAVQGDFSQLRQSFLADPRIWKHDLLGALVLMHCKVTGKALTHMTCHHLLTLSVWDITYTSVASQISILSQTQSNGSIAGISSMLGTRQLGTLANIFQDESTGPLSRSSPDNFIHSFEIGMSKAYSYPLASQLSPRHSFLVQERYVKAVTSLPVTALWFLVAANLVYALLGMVLTFWAFLKLTEEAGQAQDKFGIASLVTALFDREHPDGAIVREKTDGVLNDLEEERSTKRLGIIRTNEKNVDFVISKQ
jgi:hypothetical protein